MTEPDIVANVKAPFSFLFDDYGFEVIVSKIYANSSNWIVVLESPACGRLLTLHDRGEIIVALGPTQSPLWTDGPWFDAAVVAEYLSEGADMLKTTHGDLDEQLAVWAEALQPYMPQTCQLFTPSVFASAHAALDRIGARREAALSREEPGNGHGPNPGWSRDDL